MSGILLFGAVFIILVGVMCCLKMGSVADESSEADESGVAD